MLKIVSLLFFLCIESVFPSKFAFAEVSLFDGTKLVSPPNENSCEFELDKSRYQQGKTLRNTERGQIAIADADYPNLLTQFSKPVGIEISRQTTPDLFYMYDFVNKEISKVMDEKLKPHFKRTRPYVLYKEHTCVPELEEKEKNTSSYPSGHSCMGWALGLILAEMLPEHSTQIIKRGYEIGQSRVICGYHWQSDVDASRLIAAAFIANLHASSEFQDLFRKAKEEIRKKMK